MGQDAKKASLQFSAHFLTQKHLGRSHPTCQSMSLQLPVLANFLSLSLSPSRLTVLFYNFLPNASWEDCFFPESATGNDGSYDMQVYYVMNPVRMDCNLICKQM